MFSNYNPTDGLVFRIWRMRASIRQAAVRMPCFSQSIKTRRKRMRKTDYSVDAYDSSVPRQCDGYLRPCQSARVADRHLSTDLGN